VEHEVKTISERSLIWLRHENDKFYSYHSPNQIIQALKDKKKMYSISNSSQESLITHCEFVGQFDLYEVKLFSGSKIICNEFIEVNIEKLWVPVNEINFYEQLIEFDIYSNHFKETYIVGLTEIPNSRACVIDTSDHMAVINNFLVKLQ
jgi:hypothetical protein